MSITIELSPEEEAQVRALPNLKESIEFFLCHEVALHRFRKAGAGGGADRLATQAVQVALGLKAEGVPREEMFRGFMQALDQMESQVSSSAH